MVASREILWNVGTLPNVIAMYGLMLVAMAVAGIGVLRHAEMWLSGKPAPEHQGRYIERFFDLLSWGLMQRGVVRDRFPGVFHSLIYFGFLVLLFTTTMVFLDQDLGIPIYRGNFYLAVTLMSDLFGFGVLIGCGLAAYRRYVYAPDRIHSRPADAFVLVMLALLIIQGFVLEALRIHVTADPWAAYSPVGRIIALFFWPVSARSGAMLHYIIWWFHTITVFSFIAVLPYTKFFHLLGSTANLYFKNSGRPAGALKNPGDLEKMMEGGEEFTIGLGTIRDYTWKELLDSDACTSCGRCQEACPAYNTGKPLSPKWVMLDTRNHALLLNNAGKLGGSIVPDSLRQLDSAMSMNLLLSAGGIVPAADGAGFVYQDGFRARNEMVNGSFRVLGRNAEDRIAGDVIDPDVFWSCTTCMACVEACPVGINHVDQIVGNRRNMVLMQGEIPSEAQATLRALENRGNPYGPPQERDKWMAGLDVPVVSPGDSVDYLYWVGCISAYDQRKQKIARALVTLMKSAGLSFGVLGNKETCTGDPARRLGEENLYQTLAKQNIETLRSIKFKYIVANCPHCFNTIGNEYPQFGSLSENGAPEVLHHSQLINMLIQKGKLSLKPGTMEKITFHDPCYLGRYNGEFDAPRSALGAVKSLNIVEMDRSREKAMCCGAGGGHFWMDLKIGTRVNALRADQAAETGASTVATACPFCLHMMEDGAKLTNREESMRVKDIAEVVLENLIN